LLRKANTLDFYFIHIPKCAGKTIRAYLGDYIVNGGWHTTPDNMGMKIWNRGDFKFTCVRHPIDRFISGYFFIHKMIKEEPEKMKRRKFWVSVSTFSADKNGFEEFTYWYFNKIQKHNANKLPDDIEERIFWGAERWFPKDYRYDFVAKVERLEHDLPYLAKLTGDKKIIEQEIPRVNTTNHDEWKYYVQDETVKGLIYNYYKWDIKTFNYKV
jgi:hypothetical protein